MVLLAMNERTYSRLDRLSASLLLLWAGMAFAVGFLVAPVVLRQDPGGDLAGKVLGPCFWRLDLASWFAFGLPLLMSYGARWLSEVHDGAMGAMRLWSAAALAALLMCFASMAIVNPRMESLRTAAHGAAETREGRAFSRARNISMQLMVLRMLLGLGLAAGVSCLPKSSGGAAPAGD